MQIKPDVTAAIGNTPLIKLRKASELTGCTILGKAEFMNPGQSVKDRPARQIILEAEKRGEVRPGGLAARGGIEHRAVEHDSAGLGHADHGGTAILEVGILAKQTVGGHGGRAATIEVGCQVFA